MILKIHFKLKIPLKLCQTEKLGEVEGKEKENAENMHRERKGKKNRQREKKTKREEKRDRDRQAETDKIEIATLYAEGRSYLSELLDHASCGEC